MKRPVFLGLGATALGLMLLTAGGCSNEVDVIGDWKEIPIIYGLVDLSNDSVTYIRIEKAYLPPNQSAYEVAQIADSLYYDPNDIDVVLYENGVVVDTLDRVDLTTLGIPKDPGIFADEVNYAYRTHHDFAKSVDVPYLYKIEIHNKETGKIASATTMAINSGNSFAITAPSTSKPISWSSYNTFAQQYEFAVISANWREPEDAALYDMRILFHYSEFQVDLNQAGEPEIAGTRVCKTLEWTHTLSHSTLDDPSADGVVRRDMDGLKFYEYLAEKLTPITGTNVRRCAVNIDMLVDAAGDDFAEYIKTQRSNESLVGGLYPADPYTNVEGGFGIFSTRMRRERADLELDDRVAEYLNDASGVAAALGFKNYICPCQ